MCSPQPDGAEAARHICPELEHGEACQDHRDNMIHDPGVYPDPAVGLSLFHQLLRFPIECILRLRHVLHLPPTCFSVIIC